MQEIESDLTLDAVFGIKDPLRPDVKDAVRTVRYAPLLPFILILFSFFIPSFASAVATFTAQPPLPLLSSLYVLLFLSSSYAHHFSLVFLTLLLLSLSYSPSSSLSLSSP
jgi:hypothetical protein